MKIFWSWQSDTPGKIGRFLIRDALRDAIDQLKQAPDIEEPTSKESREALHLDQDIQGVTGSPDLARTVFGKIDESEVVVADATLVGNVLDTSAADDKAFVGKKLINSNVAIELGYALRALTDRKVLLVFNEHYGTHENLPFDLRHKGGSIVFNLAPQADRKQIEEERKKLKDRFISALKPYIQNPAVPPFRFQETPSTFNKAAYFQKGEVLAQAGAHHPDPMTFSYETESLCYLRLIPVSPLTGPLFLATLKSAAQRAPLFTRERATLADHNAHGAIGLAFSSPLSSGPMGINASTQLFENGEIWSIDATLIHTESRGELPGPRYPFLPSLLFEQIYYDKLRSLIGFAAKDLGLSPRWQVELGLVGIKGLYLPVKVGPILQWWGPIQKTEIIHRAMLNGDNATVLDGPLLDFFSRVYDSTGNARPGGLCGFPPNRPSATT